MISSLIMVAFLACSWFPGLPSGRRFFWTGLTAGAFLVTTLLTMRAVFFVPLFFFLSINYGPILPDSFGKIRRISSYHLYVVAFALGVFLSWLQSPTTVVSGYSDLLRPLFGARWLANSLWLFAVSALLTGFPSSMRFPLLRTIRLKNPLGIALIVLLYNLALAALHLWVLNGQEIAAHFILWSCLWYFSLVLLIIIFNQARRWKIIWVIFGLLVLWGSSIILPPGRNSSNLENQKNLESVLSLLGPNDLLLLAAMEPESLNLPIPLDLAGRGKIQGFHSIEKLQALLGNREIAQNHHALWILTNGQPNLPWLKRYHSNGKPLIIGTEEKGLVLHQFNQAAFPRPLLLFSQKQATIPIQSIQGLHQDNIWSGAEFEMVFDLEVFSAKILEITLKGWRPEPIEKIIPNLKISINGNNLIFSQSQQTQITFQIPPETLLSHQNTLLILCPTFSTQEDPRHLGLDLETIILR